MVVSSKTPIGLMAVVPLVIFGAHYVVSSRASCAVRIGPPGRDAPGSRFRCHLFGEGPGPARRPGGGGAGGVAAILILAVDPRDLVSRVSKVEEKRPFFP
jgi:hypothetical protein